MQYKLDLGFFHFSIILFFSLFLHLNLTAQTSIGKPEITNKTYEDYNASPLNLWIEEGPNGIMYFANAEGVLIYDGVNWDLIETTGRVKSAASLAMHDNGVMYVASQFDIGYLGPNEKGRLQYISLADKIPEQYKISEQVWDCHIVDGKVFYWTTKRIYIWDGKTMEVMELEHEFHTTASVHGKRYARFWGKGLCVYENGKFNIVPGGEQFADERIYVMLPYDEQRMLIGVRDSGFFIYDGTTFEPFKTEIDELVLDNIYVPGVALDDGNFIINTLSQGAYLIDRDGKLLQTYTEEAGLVDNRTNYAYQDTRGILWIVGNNGISSIITDDSIVYIDQFEGLDQEVIRLLKFNGTLYIGTQNGLYYIGADSKRVQKFPGISGQVFGLLNVKGNLIVSSNEMGLLRIKDTSFEYIRKDVNYDFRVSEIAKSELDENRFFALTADKIFSYLLNDDQEFIEESSTPYKNQVDLLFTELENGDILYEKKNDSISYFTPNFKNGKMDLTNMEFKYYDKTNNVPRGNLIGIAFIDSTTYYFSGQNKIFTFDLPSETFKEAKPFFTDNFNSDGWRNTPFQTTSGTVFYNFGKGLTVATKKDDNSYTINAEIFKGLGKKRIVRIYGEETNENGTHVVWMSYPDGLIRYEGNLEAPEDLDFNIYLSNISVANDSLIYAGAGKLPSDFKLGYDENTIVFDYAAPLFINQERVEYSTYLEGLDDNWSSWTKNTSREYLNLPSGNYTFKAKAKSLYGNTTEEASFSFTINTPWYSTWWAYLIYILGALLLIYVVFRQRTQMLRVRQVELEKSVEDRTREVQKRLGELATVNTVSRALTEKLELSELIRRVGDEMKHLFNSDITYLALVDRENDIINFPYQDGDTIAPQKFGNGLTSKIITTGEPLLINRDVDITQEYQRMGVKNSGKAAISYLGVPINAEDEVVGVLSVQSTQQESRFTEEDKRLLSTIAIHVGVALHNAELFEEAKVAKARAEEANEAKSAFLSTVSHELRTPLTSVLGFAKIIRKRLEDKVFPHVSVQDQKIKKTMKQVSENLNVVVSEGERLTTLINDVLDLAKIESGKMDWNMRPILLQEAINRAIASTQSLIEGKSLKLNKIIPSDLPLINGDQDKLIQVVINLLSNAIKFTDKGKVGIEAYVDKDQIIVEIHDTGIGIAEEDKHKVFEKFRQAGDTLTDKPKGTGLGLPICREIIEHHGGIIWMNSEPEVGSTFFFSLPIIKNVNVQPPMQLDRILKSLKKQIKHSSQNSKSNKKQTILVVDDDTPIRSLLRQELGEAGYNIKEAADGKAALEMVRNSKPDLIILDVMMPEINGFDVAAVLKNDPATMDIPIIILSIVQDKERGMRIGVDRYLTKPINTEQLFHEVDVLLEQGVSKKKVLVVDDNTTAVKSLSDVLSARGYKVMEGSPNDVIQTAAESQPDIIMLNSVYNADQKLIKNLKQQKGMENVMFFIYE